MRLGPVAEMGEERRPPALRALHVFPHGSVLSPPGLLGLARGRQARGQRSAIPRPDDPSHGSVRRRRRGRHHAGPGQMPDHRPHRVLIGTPSQEPGEVGQGHVVSPVQPRPAQPLGDAFERVLRHTGTLDEEHVQTLVTLLGEQQAP